jgi:hypothetical protein
LLRAGSVLCGLPVFQSTTMARPSSRISAPVVQDHHIQRARDLVWLEFAVIASDVESQESDSAWTVDVGSLRFNLSVRVLIE